MCCFINTCSGVVALSWCTLWWLRKPFVRHILFFDTSSDLSVDLGNIDKGSVLACLAAFQYIIMQCYNIAHEVDSVSDSVSRYTINFHLLSWIIWSETPVLWQMHFLLKYWFVDLHKNVVSVISKICHCYCIRVSKPFIHILCEIAWCKHCFQK